MDTGEIFEGIQSSQVREDAASSGPRSETKFIVFSAGSLLYALKAEDVQEIMLDLDIHYLPFVPPFVRGLINRLGEPLTVLDLVKLLYGRLIEGRAFIILKPHISKMAFLIDAVRDIAWVSPASIRRVSAANLDGCVVGVFSRKDEEVTILSLEEIIAAVSKALDDEG
ncbi:MAG: chemotaxis protein CheW [Spirochaetota bacterium]